MYSEIQTTWLVLLGIFFPVKIQLVSLRHEGECRTCWPTNRSENRLSLWVMRAQCWFWWSCSWTVSSDLIRVFSASVNLVILWCARPNCSLCFINLHTCCWSSVNAVSPRRLDGKHVVFGRVVEGMEVVQKMESYGSQSGKTSQKIAIADSGEL